jgi:hypothetical protein
VLTFGSDNKNRARRSGSPPLGGIGTIVETRLRYWT